jgi:hypothetical protein
MRRAETRHTAVLQTNTMWAAIRHLIKHEASRLVFGSLESRTTSRLSKPCFIASKKRTGVFCRCARIKKAHRHFVPLCANQKSAQAFCAVVRESKKGQRSTFGAGYSTSCGAV